MSLEFEIDAEARRIRTWVRGRLALEDLLAYVDRVRASDTYDRTFDGLFDLSGAEDVALSTDDVRVMARTVVQTEFGPTSADARTAVVAPQDGLYGFARMYQTHRELGGQLGRFRVFRTLREAEEWLDEKDRDDDERGPA